MKKIIFILLFSSLSNAADFVIGVTPVANSVGDTQVSSISNSKITGLGALALKSTITDSDIVDNSLNISKILNLQSSLNSKADQSSVTASLALKADSSSLGLLATKTTVTNAEIIDGALAISKISSLQSTLDSKADISTVNSALALKADSSSLGSLATKSTVTNTEVADGALNISKILNLQTSLNAKADTSTVNSALALKADTSSLGALATLNTVGDSEVSSISNTKITGLGTLSTKSVVTDSEISNNSISSSKILNFASSVVSAMSSTLSGYLSKSEIKAPTIQKFTTVGACTYNLPLSPAPLFIRVRMVGGGGGGGAGGFIAQGGSFGGAGGNTFFGSVTTLLAGGGGGGESGAVSGGAQGGTGGTVLLGAGIVGTALPGSQGLGNSGGFAQTVLMGAIPGASTPFGSGTAPNYAWVGGSSPANTGVGGAGGIAPGTTNGGGGYIGGFLYYLGASGGAGGYIDAVISGTTLTGLGTSIPCSVGAAGTGASSGVFSSLGKAGGTGYIEVTEYYQ